MPAAMPMPMTQEIMRSRVAQCKTRESPTTVKAETKIALVKDGAYYCYCAYVLRILRYSDFLSVMLTNTGIFLRGLKLSGESRS